MLKLGLKLSVTVLAFAAISSYATAADAVDEDIAKSVARALELPYMKVYRGSSCYERNVDERWYLKCTASKDIVGGLWTVAPGPVLVPVNGKAIQHAENLEPVVMNDLSIVPVKQWRDVYPDEVPDVQSVLKAYK